MESPAYSSIMGRPRRKCPWHEDQTASLIKYPTQYYCHGACDRIYTNDEVKAKGGEFFEDYEENEETVSEDLTDKLRYIQSLRRIEHRGFHFPTDEIGYYILYPGESYYKYRFFDPKDRPKYLGPRACGVPLFWARRTLNPALVVVEGEMNALSVAKAFPEWDACSPGSWGNFDAKNLRRYLSFFKRYSKLVVVLDRDGAGEKGLTRAKAFFKPYFPLSRYHLLEPDANEILLTQGEDGVRNALQRADCK